MKQYDNIDDLFRDKFSDFELDPPDHVWDNIRKEISGGPGGGGKGPGKGGIIGLSALLITLGGLLVFFTYPRPQNNEPALLATLTPEVIHPSNHSPDGQENISDNTTDYFAGTSQSKTVAIRDALQSGEDIQHVTSKSEAEHVQKEKSHTSLTGVIPGQIKNSIVIHPDPVATRISGKYPYVTPEGKITFSATQGFSDKAEKYRNTYLAPTSYHVGLFFTPEIILYPSDNNKQKRSYALDLHFMLQNSGYILQSGLGVAFSEDNGNYTLNYEKYLGAYQDVYDITFDSTESGIIPHYHTQTVDVYDSIRYISISESKNRYTYLQVPILVGYGREYKRISWFVKGGPSVSLLVHKKIPGIDFPESDIRVVMIDENVPERIRLHWQVNLSAGIGYRLSNHLSMVFEPALRYYIKPAYLPNTLETKHPYSYGIKTGLLINF